MVQQHRCDGTVACGDGWVVCRAERKRDVVQDEVQAARVAQAVGNITHEDPYWLRLHIRGRLRRCARSRSARELLLQRDGMSNDLGVSTREGFHFAKALERHVVQRQPR
jgi:hypothetical protein